MSNNEKTLCVFLCHSSGDKATVRGLYQRLKADGFDPWLDEQSLLPGHDWDSEIRKAVQGCDIVVVCLSRQSINKKGYVQKEIRLALDEADKQPEGTIYIIPLKLEECDVPARLSRWHWVNWYEDDGYERLVRALNVQADKIERQASPSSGIQNEQNKTPVEENKNDAEAKIDSKRANTFLLYLQDEETAADSGFGNELTWTIQLTPLEVTSLASRTEPISLTKNELIYLAGLSEHDIFVRLFAKFGINDFSSQPGYPKGPYFSVHPDVYKEIRRQGKTLQMKLEEL